MLEPDFDPEPEPESKLKEEFPSFFKKSSLKKTNSGLNQSGSQRNVMFAKQKTVYYYQNHSDTLRSFKDYK